MWEKRIAIELALLIGLLFLFTRHNKKEEIMRPASTSRDWVHEARYYKRLDGKNVLCNLCFRNCHIRDGQRGFCKNRLNQDGKLYTLVHSKPSAIQVDPVEKEPQFHLLPGTKILCFGTAGCNFQCIFCQNWHLSMFRVEDITSYSLSPEEAVELAIKKGIPTMSFTYNDPIAFYEYIYDIAKIAKEKGINILWHSNGSLNPEPLRELLKYTDAVTIDLKGFTDTFYEKIAGARLEPVLGSLKIIKEEGKWLEIVNLVIPTLNDNMDDIRRMCIWIRENLGPDVPMHFTRFYPSYKLKNAPLTPVETLEKARQIAKEEGLNYVYIGNVPGHPGENTFCPKCGEKIISRIGFFVISNNIEDGKCKFCGKDIPGLWKISKN